MNAMDSLYVTIESTDFRQKSQIINNLSSFTSLFESIPAYEAFLKNYSPYPREGAELLVKRINKLLFTKSDEKYLHKYDAALAIYLYLLYSLHRKIFQELTTKLVLPENTWWASQMSTVLLKKINSDKTIYEQKTISNPPPSNKIWASNNVDIHNSATKIIDGVFSS